MAGSVLLRLRWLIWALTKVCLWLAVVSTLVILSLISIVSFLIQQSSLKMASGLVDTWEIFDHEAPKSLPAVLLREFCQSFKRM